MYVYSEAGIDRFSPDGTHRWHVATDDTPYDEPSSIISGGSTLYHERGLRRGQALLARDVATGNELWPYDTAGWTLTASESALIVGNTGDGGGGRVRAIDAESGEDRWQTGLWVQSSAVLSHDLCLVPHYTYLSDQGVRKNSLPALDATTGERQWQYSHAEADDNEALQVVGDTAYLLTKFGVGAYELPGGEERWRRSLDLRQQSMAAAGPDTARTDTIVTGSRAGTLLGLDVETGDMEWGIELEGSLVRISTIARWEETVVVVGGGGLYGFDVASGEEQWRQEVNPTTSASLRAVIDGTLFVITTTEDDERNLETYDMESGRRRWRRGFGDGWIDDGVAADRFVVLTEAGELSGFRAD